MTIETLKTICLSVDKWVGIIKMKTTDLRGGNCPLCQTYAKCEGCPIVDMTGGGQCIATPYADWLHLQNTKHHMFGVGRFIEDHAEFCRAIGGYYVFDVVSWRLAKREVVFLKRLANWYATSHNLPLPYA